MINVIGVGLDGADGLGSTVLQIIQQATVLAGSKRHLSYFASHSGIKICLADLNQGIEQIKQDLKFHNSIVVLASGDPLFFGIGRLLLANFAAEQIKFYPHPSSIQLAFSRLKIPWQDAVLTSVHGRSNDELIKLFKQGQEKIGILTDQVNNPAAIARLYLALDLPLKYDFYLAETLGDSDEKITHFASEELDKLSTLQSDSFASLNVLILIRQADHDNLDLNSLPIMGISDRYFLSFRDRPSLITKKEIRIAILGELSLQPQQTIWDIGAGTGSVSIEIARLCPKSQIFAIEKTSMGATLITQNSQRFQTLNITVVQGKAPESLSQLPSPERIFIGGSGGNLIDILNICQQKLLLSGKIVMAFATIEHSYQAINWLSENNWEYHLLQLQISRSVPVNHLTRFTPLNPVTIITAISTI